MDDREIAGVRRAIDWLQRRAQATHDDPNRRDALIVAAFDLRRDLAEWSKPVTPAADAWLSKGEPG